MFIALGKTASPAIKVLGANSGTSEVIFGWGQYKDRVSLLPKAEQDKVDRLADLIVSSFAQFDSPPYRKVIINGHADKDWQGAAWEDTVSFNRAQAVQEVLTSKVLKLWAERKMGPPPPGGVAWEVNSFGAKKLLGPAYSPRNRRVEVVLVRAGAPIPAPVEDSLAIRVGRLLTLLQNRPLPNAPAHRQKRAPCVLNKMLLPDVVDVFVDGDAANQRMGRFQVNGRLCEWNGNYDPPPLPEADFRKFLGSVGSILRGSGFHPSQSDDHVLMLFSEVMRRIDLGINQVDNYIQRNPSISAGHYTGDHTRKRLQNIYRDQNDPRSIYSCYQ